MAQGEWRSSITDHGITWTFASDGDGPNGEYWCGRYLDGIGQWWVLKGTANGGVVKITDINPKGASSTGPSQPKFGNSTTWYTNGSQFDWPGGHSQAFLSGMDDGGYVHTRNVGMPSAVGGDASHPGCSGGGGAQVGTSNPIVVKPPSGSSKALVSSKFNDPGGYNSTRGQVDRYNVLTIVDSQPADTAFRPCFSGPYKWEFDISDVNMGILPRLPYPSTDPANAYGTEAKLPVVPDPQNGPSGRTGGDIPPEPASCDSFAAYQFDRPWVTGRAGTNDISFCANFNTGAVWGTEIAAIWSSGMLALCLDRTVAEKRALALHMCQASIDALGVYKNTGGYDWVTGDTLFGDWNNNGNPFSKFWGPAYGEEANKFVSKTNGGTVQHHFLMLYFGGAMMPNERDHFWKWNSHPWAVGRHYEWQTFSDTNTPWGLFNAEWGSTQWRVSFPNYGASSVLTATRQGENNPWMYYDATQHSLNGAIPSWMDKAVRGRANRWRRITGHDNWPASGREQYEHNALYQNTMPYAGAAAVLFTLATTGFDPLGNGDEPWPQGRYELSDPNDTNSDRVLVPDPNNPTTHPYPYAMARQIGVWRQGISQIGVRSYGQAALPSTWYLGNGLAPGFYSTSSPQRLWPAAMYQHYVTNGNLGTVTPSNSAAGTASLTATATPTLGGGVSVVAAGTASFSAAVQGGGGVTGWLLGWTYRQPVNLDWTMLAAGDETDFTAPVSVTLPPAKLQPGAQDLKFTTDDGETVIYHDVESYDSGTGVARCRLHFSMLETSSVKSIFAYYGNSGAAAQWDTSANTYPDRRALYTFQSRTDGRGATIRSTMLNLGDGTGGWPSEPTYEGVGTEPTEAGLWTDALSFDNLSPDSYVDCGTANVDANNTTIIAVVKFDNFDQHDARIISKSVGTGGDDHVFMLSTLDNQYPDAVGDIVFRGRIKIGATDGATTQTLIGTTPLSVNTWYLVALTYDESNGLAKLYVNGVQEAVASGLSGGVRQNAYATLIGANPPTTTNKEMQGAIDHVEIYDRVLGSSHLTKLWQLYQNPSMYVTQYTEQTYAEGGGQFLEVSALDEMGLQYDSARVIIDQPVGESDSVNFLDYATVTLEAPPADTDIIVGATDSVSFSDNTVVNGVDIFAPAFDSIEFTDETAIAQDIYVQARDTWSPTDTPHVIPVADLADPYQDLIDESIDDVFEQVGELITYYPSGNLSNPVEIYAIVRATGPEADIVTGHSLVDSVEVRIPQQDLSLAQKGDLMHVSFLGRGNKQLGRVARVLDDRARLWRLEVERG